MGWFSRLFGKDPKLKNDFGKYGQAGQDAYKYGQGLSDEGLAGMRADLRLFDDRLRNPLGEEGEAIFRRAGGQIADTAVRRNRAFAARLAERVKQSGGTLSPAAVAELEQETQRDVAEEQFKSEFDLASEHAALSLAETNKLFDRRTDIRKTMLGLSEAEKTRGLEAWFQALGYRERRVESKRRVLSSFANALIGAAAGGAASGAGSTGGGSGPWG